MNAAASTRNIGLLALLGLDQPVPAGIRHEAARELCAEILGNLDNTSRAHEFAERAAFILYGDSSCAIPVPPRQTAHLLCQFVATSVTR